MAISIHSVILAVKMAFKKSKDYTDQKTSGLVAGITYKGAVSYYSDLANLTNVEEGFAYTVKYSGTSGTTPDGTEYVWGYDSDLQALAWIDFSKDSYTKAQTDAIINPINEQVELNKNNILMFEQMNSTKNKLNFLGATDKATNCTTSNKTSKSIDISTDTTWAFYNYAILLPAGDYVAMIKIENYTTTGETDSRFGVFKTNSATQGAGTTAYFHADGTYISTFTADGTTTYYPTIYLNPSGTAADISLTADNIMVIPKSIYDAGFTDYQPYAMSNAEITAWILSQS